MDNADLRALLLGAMKTAYEAGHHATVEGHYHEEWPDDHVDDWMDDEGITAPGYVRVPVEALEWLNGERGEFVCPTENYFRGKPPTYWWRTVFRQKAMLTAAQETPND